MESNEPKFEPNPYLWIAQALSFTQEDLVCRSGESPQFIKALLNAQVLNPSVELTDFFLALWANRLLLQLKRPVKLGFQPFWLGSVAALKAQYLRHRRGLRARNAPLFRVFKIERPVENARWLRVSPLTELRLLVVGGGHTSKERFSKVLALPEELIVALEAKGADGLTGLYHLTLALTEAGLPEAEIEKLGAGIVRHSGVSQPL